MGQRLTREGEEIGIGIIGYGIGKVHAHAWSNIPVIYGAENGLPRPKLVGLAGRNVKNVSEVANNFGFEKTTSNWQDLVKDPRVSILDDCAPPNLHLEPCVAAAEARKAVVCEKPLARTSEEAYQMYKGVGKTGQVSMTGFCVRFAPAIVMAKNLIESGRLGKIYNFRCSYLSIEPGINGYLDPDYPLHWHFQREIAGQGAIADLGCHALDMAYFLLGDVVEVSGASQTFVPERPLVEDPTRKGKVTVDDATVASLKFKSGALGVIDVSWMASGKKDFFYFEVNGSEGSVRFNFERLTEIEVYLKEGGNLAGFRTVQAISKKHPFMDRFWVDQGGGFSWNHLFVVELKHFLDSVVQGKVTDPLIPTFRDGYINSVLIDSIVESNKRGGWVNVSPKP